MSTASRKNLLVVPAIAIFAACVLQLAAVTRRATAAEPERSAAEKAVLRVLGVPAGARGSFLDALEHSPRLVTIDWRAEPGETLTSIARAAAPLDWKIEAVGEEDEDGRVPFTFTRAGSRRALRARLNGGPKGDDRDRFISDLAALAGTKTVFLRVELFRGSDTDAYVVLSPAEAAALRQAAGPFYARWFGPLRPQGPALVVPR